MGMSLGPLMGYLDLTVSGYDRLYDCLIPGCGEKKMKRGIVWRHFWSKHRRVYEAARSKLICRPPTRYRVSVKSRGIRYQREVLVEIYNAMEHRAEIKLEVTK